MEKSSDLPYGLRIKRNWNIFSRSRSSRKPLDFL